MTAPRLRWPRKEHPMMMTMTVMVMMMTRWPSILLKSFYDQLDFPIDDEDGDGDDADRVGQARSILLKTLYAGLSWNFLNCDRAFG